MLKSQNFENKISKSSIGLRGFNFSKRITTKYGIFRNKNKMPDLILARLFFNKIANKETKNPSNQKVLKNYFRFNFNIFFEAIRQLTKNPKNYYYLQKPSNLADQKLQPETDVLPQMGETSQNITFQNKYPLSFVHQIYPYHYPQSMDLDQKPLEFFRSNIPPSSFKKCPGILQHLIFHLISKSQKTDVTLLQHSRVIKNIFYRSVYKKDEIRKNILPRLSYFGMDSNNIALNYINPVNIGYIQRAFNTGKAGSINKAIHLLDREKNSLELSQEKEKTFFTGENIVTKKPEAALKQYNRVMKKITYGTIPKASGKKILFSTSHSSANIALNYINPVNIGYIQRAFNAGKAGSINKAIHPLDIENNFLELSQEKQKAFFTGENIVTKKPEDALKQNNRIIKNITYGMIPKAIGKKILFLTSHSSANIAPNYTNPVNIDYIQRAFNTRKAGSINKAIHVLDKEKNSLELSKEKEKTFFTGENIVTKKPEAALKQNNRDIKNITYGTIPKAIGKNILFSPSHSSANIALNYTNPATINYIQRAFNTGKAGSINKAIHPRDIEKNSLELSQEKEKAFFTGENIVTKKPEDALKQNNRDIKNITYGTIPKAIGKNILFSTSHSSANIALNYTNPVNIGYIQRAVNAERAGSITSPFHPVPLNNVRDSLGLSARKISAPSIKKNEITKRGRTLMLKHRQYSEILFPDQGINGDNIMKKGRPVGSRDIAGNVTYGTKELVLKKTVTRPPDVVPDEDNGLLQTEKIDHSKTIDNLVKEALKEKSAHEIGKIADRVYKLIERKISIEKDRRGLY